MRSSIDLVALGNTASLFLAVTFTLCVVFDLVFPQLAMFEVWRKLLPGFERISWKSYLLGLVESYGFGWYFALVWAPLYNYFAARSRA
jgi:cytochrome c biogenesis protein CcdA